MKGIGNEHGILNGFGIYMYYHYRLYTDVYVVYLEFELSNSVCYKGQCYVQTLT